jgi:hypothetical protein
LPAPGDARPPVTSSSMTAAFRGRYLLDLLARVPDPGKKRGRRHALAGLLIVGVAVGRRGQSADEYGDCGEAGVAAGAGLLSPLKGGPPAGEDTQEASASVIADGAAGVRGRRPGR